MFEENIKQSSQKSETTIPKDTKITCKLETQNSTEFIELVIRTNNGSLIRCVVIFAEQIFDEESYIVYGWTVLRQLTSRQSP